MLICSLELSFENVKRPHEIFIDRKNSKGFDYADAENLKNLNSEFEDFSSIKFVAKSILADNLDLKELPKKCIAQGITKTIGTTMFATNEVVAHLQNNMPSNQWQDVSLDIKKGNFSKSC